MSIEEANKSRFERGLMNLTELEGELLVALTEAREIVVDTIEAVGECDHSVNLCRCGEESVLFSIDAAISKANGCTLP